MARYLIRRLLQMVPLLFGISLVAYAVMAFAPGDPARLLIDPERMTAEQLAAVRADLGLDDPLPIQYAKTMRSLVAGDLRSFKTRQKVLDMVGERLPTTLALGGLSLLFGTTFGLVIGVVQALRPYSLLDDLGTLLSLLGFSVPHFWLGLMLVLVFAVWLRWLPASGIRPVGATGWSPWQVAPYLVLPTIVLGSGVLASVARYTRSAMLESLGQEYVTVARAKGLAEWFVVVRHALRNSLLPVITLLGFFLPILVGGSVVVETIFSLPGLGRLALEAVYTRDYPVILSVNLLGAIMVLLGNLCADIAYTAADPRIRVS